MITTAGRVWTYTQSFYKTTRAYELQQFCFSNILGLHKFFSALLKYARVDFMLLEARTPTDRIFSNGGNLIIIIS